MSPAETYMQRCLELAANGLGKTAPNPLVGALVVRKDQIIGEGYHHAAGQAHAEVEAIMSVKNKEKLSESTLYVNLEPCNHLGKTPACTDLILQHNIPQVIIGQTDPNPIVSGAGIERLRQNQVVVQTGILLKPCLDLNRRFNTFHAKKRPYIILKWAQTQDGYMDLFREAGQAANPAWITDEYCRMLVHRWRSEEPAILVGTRTALMDNPRLNVRSWTGRNPLRIVIDRHGVLPPQLNVFDQSQETWVFGENPKQSSPRLTHFHLDSERDDLDQILQVLYEQDIQSLLIEGGAELLSSFIQNNLWDEARVFTGPGTFGKGVTAPEFNLAPQTNTPAGNSQLAIYRNH